MMMMMMMFRLKNKGIF